MNSKYWLDKKNSLIAKKARIQAVITELDTINTMIKNVPEVLDASEKYFRDGGYYDGDTLDRGVLRGCSSDLESALITITSTISTGKAKITELDGQIKICDTNYYECLKEEKKD